MKHIIIAVMIASAVARSVSAQPPSVSLLAKEAGITGGADYFANGDFIGAWNDPKAKLQWDLTVDEAGKAGVELVYSCVPSCGGKFVLDLDGQKLTGTTTSTGRWDILHSMTEIRSLVIEGDDGKEPRSPAGARASERRGQDLDAEKIGVKAGGE